MFKHYFYGAFFTSVCIRVFADQCGYGGVLDPTNTSYFLVHNNPAPWGTAETTCYKQLGHLASVNAFTKDFIYNLAQSSEAPELWLGGMINYRGVWNWTNANFGYNNWAPGEPSSNQPGMCLAMNKATGKWRSANCMEQKPYLCELPKNRQRDFGFCPSIYGWIYFGNVNKCYLDMGQNADTHFDDIISGCKQANAKPLVINNQIEMNDVQAIMNANLNNIYGCAKRYALGLQYFTNGSYIWADGSKLNFTDWIPQDPPEYNSCYFGFSFGNNRTWVPSLCNVDGVPMNIICEYIPK